ncbi:FecR domain-containing protein [Reichenbachiella sp. MALMAid0571]|uniref:FecR family protein n=1 Tax=Reichenbachiella sp. MALMAid0571 TaxID=3143939 RepID=UPI0032DEAE5E
MTKQEFFELADRYSMYQCTEEEKKLYEQFCNQMSEHNVIDSWDVNELEETRIRLLSKLTERIVSDEQPTRQYWKSTLKIAASITVIFGLTWFFYQKDSVYPEQDSLQLVEKRTSAGQKLTVVLPDGSTVRLNSESEISYNENFSNSIREVQLKGEAFFDVVKNPNLPFKVITENLTTTVLGTSFNVDAYNAADQKVTVATGKVEVELNNTSDSKKSKVFLIPRQQVVVSETSNDLIVNTVELEEALAWKDNRLVFKNVSLLEASKELEKWFGVKIKFSNEKIKSCKFSNVYSNEPLEKILKELKFILNVDYEISKENIITLTGNGCTI